MKDRLNQTMSNPECYNPTSIANYYRQRPRSTWGRWSKIIRSFSLFWLYLLWDRITGGTIEKQHQRAVQLRDILTTLGPTFIKIGQALSTRPDLLPVVYLHELAKLQDAIPPFSNQIAYQFIEEELGAAPSEIYAELSSDPIAAASLGQVYKGKLKTGETVAVKVQRPDLAATIALDLHLLRQLANQAQRRIRSLRHTDLVAIVDEFGARVFEELDYTQEGHNAENFANLYGHLPDIYVPRIYWTYTRQRVLTMEWITGTKLTQPAAIEAQGIQARHLVEVGVQCCLQQLLEHGFFHADPHPGNLLAMPNGKLAYLDFGMMSQVQPHQRYGIINAVVHIINRDFEELVQDYIQLDFLPPDVDVAPIASALATVFQDALTASIAEFNFQNIIEQLSALMYKFPFRVPAYYALIIRSLVTFEGIAIGIDPQFKVLSSAAPYVAMRLLNDPAPELQASLSQLLLKDNRFRWNRLANLLEDAQNSDSYRSGATLNQIVDFVLSDRGQLLRDGFVAEIALLLDRVKTQLVRQSLQSPSGIIALFNLNQAFSGDGTNFGIDPDTFYQLKRIWRAIKRMLFNEL